MGQLSSVMTIAGAGLLPDPPADIGIALTANVVFESSIGNYAQVPIVDQFANVTVLANAVIGNGTANITQSTYETLFTIGASNFPALTNIPSAGNSVANLLPNGVSSNVAFITDVLTVSNQQILGNGDLSKFCQAFMTAQGYLSQANALLKSLRNSEILEATFDPKTGGMDTLTTGGINQVTSDPTTTASDLSLLGQTISLANLDDLGLPGELLAQIGRVAGGELAVVTDLLQAAGVPRNKIQSLASGINDLSAAEEKSAYSAMLAVTGQELQQILLILRARVTVMNMAQLLDPKKLFPNSFKQLLCPGTDGLASIYLADGAVNSDLRTVLANPDVASFSGPNNTNSLQILEKTIPADQALANKALARSLAQVKNIAQSSLPGLAAAMSAVTSNSDLDAVTGLSVPIPTDVKQFYQQQLVQGTGPDGLITLFDMLGSPSGVGLNTDIETVESVLGNLDTGNLSSCYDNMSDVLGNVYGDAAPIVIPSGPGAGSYSSWDDAFVAGLIPAANTEVSTIVASSSDQVAIANSAWGNIVSALSRQRQNEIQAEIDLSEFPANSQTATMSFTTNLHDYGTDVAPGGANQYLESVANVGSLSGQSVLASLREGRNIQALQEAGLSLDTQLSDR